MKKRIVVASDGTWNRPEKDLKEDFPTNVLRLARAIKPVAADGVPQQVFYDWGVGSYYDKVVGGATGLGLHKNIMDGYRYIVQNYHPGDEIWLFGFSRGAYTVRSLCGLINNCGILKRPDARLIQMGFDLYKKPGGVNAPSGANSVAFRRKHSHESREVTFVGVWDTVGAMGIPKTFLGLFEDKDEFYDTKLGRNVRAARHAMAIDEIREDFEPTIWKPKKNLDLKQVWFAGAHADIGGSCKPDKNKLVLSDITLQWMVKEAGGFGLSVEQYMTKGLKPDARARINPSRRSFYRLRGKYERPIDHGCGPVLIHETVKAKWDLDRGYRPKELKKFVKEKGWDSYLVS